MEEIIYVQLLEEGTDVFRPVPAIRIEKNIFKLMGVDMYNPEDETWEFSPGTYVQVEERRLNDENVFVAIKKT